MTTSSRRWPDSVGTRLPLSTGCFRYEARDTFDALNAGEIHVWRADLGTSMHALATLARTLAPDESAKAGRFRRALDRDRYVLSHGVLRAILARYLCVAPSELVFRDGTRGKPELANGEVGFNMSRSQDVVVCAVGAVRDVGVDVEYVRPGIATDVMRCLAPNAERSLPMVCGRASDRAFFRRWTRLEAYAKARGDGLGLSPDTLKTFLDATRPGLVHPRDGDERTPRWWLHDFTPWRGYVAALAAPWGERTVRYWNWQPQTTGSRTRCGTSPRAPIGARGVSASAVRGGGAARSKSERPTEILSRARDMHE
jgi:4'-phosphopantetheinyl transferase